MVNKVGHKYATIIETGLGSDETHEKEKPYLGFNSQQVWAGNLDPNYGNSLAGLPVIRSGSGFAFQQAGTTTTFFDNKQFDLFPAAPFDPLGPFSPDPFSLAMDCMQMSPEPPARAEDKSTGIPLICLLCPKQPKFSDVSHLLTHISSKSHLAAQFKLQHSGKVEDKRSLDQYKLWSDENGVDKLVANRIAAKELKKPAKRVRLASIEKKSGKNVKLEVDDYLVNHFDNAGLRPNPNAWHLHAPRDNSFEALYSTPPYNDNGVYPFPDSPSSSVHIKHETSQTGTETSNRIFLSEALDIDDGDSSSRLKGTVYPGMGLFDAATPVQKRKRNQKKHASVVRSMEMTSASIGPDEDVWDITMSEVTRTRNVYDSPSIDGSPDFKYDVPSTTKKRRSRRSAVASSGPRRQTRASTRAATNSKAGKRRVTKQSKKLVKVEDEDEDDGDSHVRVAGNDNTSTGDDIFQEHHQSRQDANGAASVNQFNLPFRAAMYNLPTNTPLMSSSSFFARPGAQNYFQGFGMKENDSMGFPLQQQGSMPGYFAQHRQSLQANASGFNPLCMQRPDNYPFFYGGHSFDASKPPTPAFQVMNGTDYGNLDSAPCFQTGHVQQDDFDI